MSNELPPLPHWITDHGENHYTVDLDEAVAAGETIPIELYKIPQFDKFWTNPPTERGQIDFKPQRP
jgi:hypothetical protein